MKAAPLLSAEIDNAAEPALPSHDVSLVLDQAIRTAFEHAKTFGYTDRREQEALQDAVCWTRALRAWKARQLTESLREGRS